MVWDRARARARTRCRAKGLGVGIGLGVGLGLAMAVLAARQFYGAFTMDNRVPTCSIIHAFTITRVYMYVNYGLE